MAKRNMLVAAVVGLVILCVGKWNIIAASMISLLTSLVATVPGLHPTTPIWNVDLLEYWIASIGLMVIVVLAVRALLTLRRPVTQRLDSAQLFLLGFVSIALLVPFLVSVPPNAQGDLLTTRLLAPLSSGTVSVPVAEDSQLCEVNRIERHRRRANDFLLNRAYVINGEENLSGDSAMISKSRITFLFGTDDVGRDVFSRVVAGTRVSLAIGFSAAVAALVLGVFVGCASGYGGRILDGILMRLTDLFLSVPALVLILGIIAVVGLSTVTLVTVLALTGWMGIARTVRTEVRKLREAEFVLAASLLGQSPMTIVTRHVLPNLRHILAAAIVLQFGNAILAEASLSFLGLGVQPPTASWGNMLGQSLGNLRNGWWLGLFPGLALVTVLIAANIIVEKAQQRP